MRTKAKDAGTLREFSIRHLGTDRHWSLRRPEGRPRLIYQMEGSARYEVDGRRHTLKGGHVLVAHGRLSGWGDSPFVEVQVPLSILLEAPDILGRTRRSGKRRAAIVVKPGERGVGALESILVRLFREQEMSIAGRDILVRIILLELFVLLYRVRLRILPHWQQYETLRTLLSHKRVQGVISYAAAHCSQSLSLETLAQMAGVNRTAFCRIHRVLTGTTPHRLMSRARIEQAKELVGRTDVSLTEISQRIGFADPPSFFRAFRHHCGITPLAYRKRAIRRRASEVTD